MLQKLINLIKRIIRRFKARESDEYQPTDEDIPDPPDTTQKPMGDSDGSDETDNDIWRDIL